jgi:hypothetical protein
MSEWRREWAGKTRVERTAADVANKKGRSRDRPSDVSEVGEAPDALCRIVFGLLNGYRSSSENGFINSTQSEMRAYRQQHSPTCAKLPRFK